MIAVELKLILNIPIRLVAIYWGNAVGQHGGNSVKHFQIFPMRNCLSQVTADLQRSLNGLKNTICQIQNGDIRFTGDNSTNVSLVIILPMCHW